MQILNRCWIRTAVAMLAVMALGAPQTFAQPTSQVFEIDGKVLEYGSGQPLAGVTVQMMPGNGLLVPGAPEVQTDAGGRFHFTETKPGRYVVGAIPPDGYSRVTALGYAATQISFELGNDEVGEITFQLQRASVITGRLVDRDTEEPISGFLIGLNSYRARDGIVISRGTWVRTDSNGDFEMEVSSGSYLLEVRKIWNSWADRVMTEFSAEDALQTDTGYAPGYYPGGPSPETALPVSVTAGAAASFGTIALPKAEYARVLFDVNESSCPGGAELHVRPALNRFRLGEGGPQFPVPCVPFLLKSVDPGNYRIDFTAGEGEEAVRAMVHINVLDDSFTVPVTLGHGTTLSGQVILQDSAERIPLEDLKVSFGPVAGSIPINQMGPQPVNADGSFSFPNSVTFRRRVSVEGLPDDYFVQGIRFGGVALPGELFTFDGTGTLEIEIGQSPGVLRGTVLEHDDPVSRADVVLIPWPAEPDDDQYLVKHFTAGGDGRFEIPKIVPGDYRLFAVRAEDKDVAQHPLPWNRLLERAEKLTVTRGEEADLRIEVADPRR